MRQRLRGVKGRTTSCTVESTGTVRVSGALAVAAAKRVSLNTCESALCWPLSPPGTTPDLVFTQYSSLMRANCTSEKL